MPICDSSCSQDNQTQQLAVQLRHETDHCVAHRSRCALAGLGEGASQVSGKKSTVRHKDARDEGEFAGCFTQNHGTVRSSTACCYLHRMQVLLMHRRSSECMDRAGVSCRQTCSREQLRIQWCSMCAFMCVTGSCPPSTRPRVRR